MTPETVLDVFIALNESLGGIGHNPHNPAFICDLVFISTH